jgi:hypothetical protein
MQKKLFLTVLVLGGLQMAATDVLAQAPRHGPSPATCIWYESGVISSDGEIRGPIVITMLQRGVDPAAPTPGWLIITPNNTWISIDQFKGPYFLKEGDRLRGRNDWTKGEVVYSGLRCS